MNAQNMLEFQNRATRKFGPSAGPFIRQIVFWDGERSVAGEGWMWKSRREMCEETGLNQKPQEKARKVLKAAGVLEEELRPVGPMKRQTLHYRANLNRLLDLLFPVSGTGYGANGDYPAYLSEETPVEGESGTGYGADEDVSAYLSDKPPVEAESAIQESTSRDSDLQSGADAPNDDFYDEIEDIIALDDSNAERRDSVGASSRPAPTQPGHGRRGTDEDALPRDRDASPARKLLERARYLLDKGRAWHAYDVAGEALEAVDVREEHEEYDEVCALLDEAQDAAMRARNKQTPEGPVEVTDGPSLPSTLSAVTPTAEAILEAEEEAFLLSLPKISAEDLDF